MMIKKANVSESWVKMFSESMRLINSVAANSGGRLYSCADIGRLFTKSTPISSHSYIYIYWQTFISLSIRGHLYICIYSQTCLPIQCVFISSHLYIYTRSLAFRP